MNVEIFCLSEGGSIKNNQVCILHTFANVFVQSIPARVAGCLVAQVRFMHDEEGDHRLGWEMRDADGTLRASGAPAVVSVPNMDQFGSRGWSQMWILSAECYEGQHEISLRIDEKVVASLLLAVIHAPPQPGAPVFVPTCLPTQ